MSDHIPHSVTGSSASGLWRGTSRAHRDGERRERLLDAALELYGTLGFRATSIQALCQESGVSSRSFYELFPAQESISAQESLLEQLYIVLNEEITKALARLTIPADANILDATVHIVTTALMPMLSDERKARVLEVEAVGVSESLEERRRATMRLLAASVASAFAQMQDAFELPGPGTSLQSDGGEPDGGQPDGGADLTSLILVGGITEALVQRVHTPVTARSSTTTFLTEIAEVALRAHGVFPQAGA